MNPRLIRLVCTVGAGGSFLYLYGILILMFVARANLLHPTMLEAVIIVTQIARLLAVVLYRKLGPKAEVVWILASLETFVVVILIGLYVLTADLSIIRLAVSIFSIWVAAIFLVASPYLIYLYMSGMFSNYNLSKVLPATVFEFSYLAFLVGIIGQVKDGFDLGNFLNILITVTRSQIVGGKNPALPVLSLAEPAIVLYMALVVYAALPDRENSKVDLRQTLIFPMISSTLVFGWLSFAINYLPNELLSFASPAIVVTAVLWWKTRGR